MTNIKKLIAGLFAVIALTFATSTFAANTATAGTVAATTAAPSTSLFNANEFGLSLSSGYVVDRSAPFQKDYSLNLSAGVFYFPSRYLGFEANIPFYQTSGVSLSEVQAGVLLRLPLSKNIVLLKHIAPYVGFDGVYNWNAADEWAYIAKGGVEYRINAKWGFFGEGQYRNNDVHDLNKGTTSVQGGLHLVF